jgi:hypothetical protein
MSTITQQYIYNITNITNNNNKSTDPPQSITNNQMDDQMNKQLTYKMTNCMLKYAKYMECTSPKFSYKNNYKTGCPPLLYNYIDCMDNDVI